MRIRVLPLLLSVLVAMSVAQVADATMTYSDVVGTNVSFTGIQESSSFGDPEPLFGQPLGNSDSLLFFPENFLATSSGGGIDSTGSHLQLWIMGNGPLDTIDTVRIDEYGDFTLGGFGGTAATGAQTSMSGFLTVTETIDGPITPVVIGFVGDKTYPNGPPSNLWGLPGDLGTFLWDDVTVIDVASVVPNATKAHLSIDNDLFAASEASTFATVQKKFSEAPGVIINVIPEPATMGLLALGGLAILRRRGR